MNGAEWLQQRLQQLKRDPQSSTTIVERLERTEQRRQAGQIEQIQRPKLDRQLFRIEGRGTVRYARRPDGTRIRMVARGDGSMVVLEPGTPEFHARYTQPPEPFIEQFRPEGPEGFVWHKLDQEGNELE